MYFKTCTQIRNALCNCKCIKSSLHYKKDRRLYRVFKSRDLFQGCFFFLNNILFPPYRSKSICLMKSCKNWNSHFVQEMTIIETRSIL